MSKKTTSIYDRQLKMLLAEAAEAFRKHDDRRLQKVLRDAITRAPHRLDLWFDLANHHILTENPKLAIAIFRDLAILVPRDVEVLFSLAHWLCFSGRADDAEVVRRRLEMSRPDASRDFEHVQEIIRKWLARDLVNTFPAPDCEPEKAAVVVLGYRLEQDGSMHPHMIDRLEKALEAALAVPQCLVVVSGGQPKSGRIEATEMKSWLVERGIPPARIFEEGYSRDVVENLIYSRQILDINNISKALIVTSAQNVRRAGAVMDILAWKYGSAWKTEVTATSGQSSPAFVDDGRDRLKLYRDTLRAYGMPMMRTLPELFEL